MDPVDDGGSGQGRTFGTHRRHFVEQTLSLYMTIAVVIYLLALYFVLLVPILSLACEP